MTGCTVRRYEQLETSPRRSSKNCDLQFANTDRFTENYSIEVGLSLFWTSCKVSIPRREDTVQGNWNKRNWQTLWMAMVGLQKQSSWLNVWWSESYDTAWFVYTLTDARQQQNYILWILRCNIWLTKGSHGPELLAQYPHPYQLFWNLGNSVSPNLPRFFGGDTQKMLFLLSGVYARGSKHPTHGL